MKIPSKSVEEKYAKRGSQILNGTLREGDYLVFIVFQTLI
jgi:hypothetical protein